MAAAADAAAMGIKLSVEPAPEAPSKTERLRAGFILILGGLLAVLQRVVLPHFLLSLGLLLVTGYDLYRPAAHWPSPWPVLMLVWLALFGGALAFLYGFLTSLCCALKAAATYAEDFFYELFESLKDKVREQIDSLEDGIAKQQARVILDNSVREVLSPLRQLRVGSVPKALLAVLVGILTFVSRSVFVARVARTAGTTVKFSRIFASRATLVGALFLNMRWLAALALWFLYGLGFAIFVLDIYWVC